MSHNILKAFVCNKATNNDNDNDNDNDDTILSLHPNLRVPKMVQPLMTVSVKSLAEAACCTDWMGSGNLSISTH
eukprot:scaffold25378_cov180-Amphora_coffeaeformis.AAC.1